MKPPAVLRAQRRLQLRTNLRRSAAIVTIFSIGLVFAALGLATSVARFEQEGSPTARVVFLALGVAFFGGGLASWLLRPMRPGIVPCFARELEPYGGTSSAALSRGRALYQEIAALDDLAVRLDVPPLSSFGFADDVYGQEVRWHPASEGLRTVGVLARGLDGGLRSEPAVAEDLDALAAALGAADRREVAFALMLRLGPDSLQVVSTMERRQGRFW